VSNVRVILDEEVDELIDVLMVCADQFTNIGDRENAGRCRRLARTIRDQKDAQIDRERRARDQERADTIEKVPDPQRCVTPLSPTAPLLSRPIEVTVEAQQNIASFYSTGAKMGPVTEERAPVSVQAESPPTPPQIKTKVPPPPPPIPVVKIPVDQWPRNADGVTRVMVQAGIGDIAWLYQKIHGLAHRWCSPVELIVAGDLPHRAQEFIELLPGVRFGGYGEFTSDEVIAAIAEKPLPMTMDEMRGLTLPISVNGHLEHGRRIESWYPEIETMTGPLPLKTTDGHRAKAAEILAREVPVKRRGRKPKTSRPTRPIVGVYAASLAAARSWGFWDAAEWAEIVTGIRKAVECDFVMIGAEWDDEFQHNIISRMVEMSKGITFRRCAGQSFGVAVEVLRGLDLLIAFPSGIPIVATMIGTPTVWWLPDRKLATGGNVSQLTGWIPKSIDEAGLIETRSFETPEDAIAGVLRSRPFASRIGGEKL
jgi:hypothetical protein